MKLCKWAKGLTALLFVGLVALLIVRHVTNSLPEVKAVAAVEKMGGQVVFAEDTDAPGWLAWAWPLKSKSVLGVKLCGTAVTDAGLEDILALQELEWLELDGTQITVAGLKTLAGFTKLRLLDLGQTSISNAGMKELAKLKNVILLSLTHSESTDNGLKELASLAFLKELRKRKGEKKRGRARLF